MAARALHFALESRGEETSGSSIGPYRLLQKIGEGGFGVVWMAEQHEPIRRRVALKIIKIGMDTEEVIARFEAERQALALMEHPNIARVFDAGATDSGRPYFVMELVRGVAISRYCDEHRLHAVARLRLFIAVCLAVQHAHQKGVIHRDLKPSNILVTLHDGVPVPKVIDFGIAKATSARLTDKTLFTQFHTFIGTPAYTSPEQIEMSGLDIDTRSDIYSLGVLLYELLTGQPPFDTDALVKSGLEAMRRTIREIDPPRPSARLGTLSAENRTSIAQHRGTDAGRLSVLLRGDLDWIAMRCLEKDRTRRYDSAAALAADIERHLADTPVLARPPSRLYQTKKFVRRHRLAVAAVAAVALSLCAGLIASSVLLMSERAARAHAVAAQTRALSAEEKERELHRQAEVARAAEAKRVARTALDLAHRDLVEGKVADGLAYLVYAARKDPLNSTLGPRLASAIVSHNFALPRAAPLAFGSRVGALRYAPDGRSFLVGTEDGMLRTVDAATGAVQRQFSVGREVVSGGWEFAPLNGGVVGARFLDNTFAVHDVATGAANFAPFPLPESVGVPMSARVVGFSPRGRWIYGLALREFWLWRADTGALQLHRRFPRNIAGCDFDPAEETFALVTGAAIERWALPSNQPVDPAISYREPTDQHASGAELRYSPDGRRLALTFAGGVQVFDVASGRRTHQMLRQGWQGTQTAFTSQDRLRVRTATQVGEWDLAADRMSARPLAGLPDLAMDAAGRRGAALALDGRLHVVDLGGNAPVVEPAWRQNPGSRIALSPDGTQVLVGTAEGLVYRFALGSGAARPLVLPRPPGFGLPAFFLPDKPSQLLLAGAASARVVEVSTGREVGPAFHYPEPMLEPSAPDRRPPIRADLKFMVVRTARLGWQSWELGPAGVTRVVPLRETEDAPYMVTFSPTGDLVAISAGRALRVWNLRSGAPVGPVLAHASLPVPYSLSFHADARRLTVGGTDGSALVYDVTTGQPGLSLATRRHVRTWAMRFSPDGKRLLTTNNEGENRIWNADSAEPIGPVVSTVGSELSASAGFSSDGRWAAIRSPESVTILDGRTGAAVGRDLPAIGPLVGFSVDGERLATLQRDGSAQVWAVPRGDPVTEPMRHETAGAQRPAFSPDGRFLKTEMRGIHLWAVPPALPDGTPPPEWLLQLATLCASQTVNDAGQLVAAPEAAADVERLRAQIAALPADAPLAGWGKWFLDERPDRPIAPGFTIVPAEAARLNPSAAASRPAP